MADALTRDEYIMKYGYDPDPVAEGQEEPGVIKNHLKSAAVGAASVIPDFLALGPIIGTGAGALIRSYTDDTKFMDEFQKGMQVEGAQKNIQEHINSIATEWKRANPQLSDDDINAGLEQYKKTKPFEDFTTSQLKGLPWFAAKFRDTARGVLGDERPESERGWTESAAEVVGGALVPGPAGWAGKAATSLAHNVPATAGVLASTPARVALKTAEVLTPLTMPYSAGNVAINAGVGIGVDQAIRYAQGKSTAFTPTVDDPHGVGTLAATGVGIGGLAAFVGAIRGRSASAIRPQSLTARTLEQQPSLDLRTEQLARSGEASVNAGPPQELGPTPSVSELNPAQAAHRTIQNQYTDESVTGVSAVRDIQGIDEANRLEGLHSSSSGAVLNDTIRTDTEVSLREFRNAMDALPMGERRAAALSMQMSSYRAHWHVVHDEQLAKIARVEHQLQQGNLSNSQTTRLSNELATLRADFQRFVDDIDPNVRLMLPELPFNQVARQADAFEADMSPGMMRVKQSLKAHNKNMLDQLVAAGKLSRGKADDLHLRNPYYVPAINDPFKGATGFGRLYRSVAASIKRATTTQSEGTGGAVAREGAIEKLGKDIPPVRTNPLQQETRITSLLDPRSAIRMYTERAYRDIAHTRMRNEFNRAFYQQRNGAPTTFQRDGHIQQHTINNRTWFDAAEEKTIADALRNPRVVPEWQGGRVRFWEYGDIEIARMLRAEPVQMNGLVKGMAKLAQWFKFGTTGKGNPVFAITGAMYDLGVGMLTRHHTRSFGPIQSAAYRYLPTSVAQNVFGRVIDPTAPVAAIGHSLRAFWDIVASHTSRAIAEQLVRETPGFAALRSVIGDPAYQAMTRAALRTASWAQETATMQLMRAGAAHGSGAVDNITNVRGAYSMAADTMPQLARNAWQFYSDVVDSIYLGPKRMFYTENYGHLHQKYNGRIPQREIDRLVYETRAIGGDMNKVPASKGMRDIEAITPYLSQTKLGAYHLLRNMLSPETALYVLPRVGMMMYAVGQSYYWRTYWNEESRADFWDRTPEHERWRTVSVPSPKLLAAWANGENPAYDRSLIYKLKIPPDITGLVAGTGAFMQMMGMIPSSATPTPIIQDLPKTVLDSLTPAMPPALQALLGFSGLKLDPQSADTRGGSLIRSFNSNFRAGPGAESTTNLGEVSNTQSLVMNALFGAVGSHLTAGMDVMMHAAKYQPPNAQGTLTPRASSDFAAGLRAATTEVVGRATKIPDVPLVWQNQDKYQVATPAWQYVQQNRGYIRSINGMKDQATGKAAQLQRELAGKAGGIPPQQLGDVALIQIAQDVAKFQNPTGELGKLAKQYRDYSAMNRAVAVNYNMPQDERRKRTNAIIGKMQDNMQQQHYAIKYFEHEVAQKYGKYLAPKLQGGGVTMQSLDQMMRESFGQAQ